MPDLIEEFLNGADENLGRLDQKLFLLETNPSDKAVWDGLDSFFNFVRSAAPFVSFPRVYRLSDAALADMKRYYAKTAGLEVLPGVLMKYQRIRKILSAAAALKREPRESDDDLLSFSRPAEENAAADDSVSAVPQPDPRSDIMRQEAALDEREEQLVLWAQALKEQEDDLKKRENVVFSEEKRQALCEQKITEITAHLNEKEKIQAELENSLADCQLALDECRGRLKDQEMQLERSFAQSEAKNKALQEMNEKIQGLENILAEKTDLSERSENALREEIRHYKDEAAVYEAALKRLEADRLQMESTRTQVFDEYENLKQEYETTMLQSDGEKQVIEKLAGEKRDLEQQHYELNRRLVALQEELAAEKERLHQTEIRSEKQKKRFDRLQAELSAVQWPLDPEQMQKELAGVAKERASLLGKPAPCENLTALANIVGRIRSRPFLEIPSFLRGFIKKDAARYERHFTFSSGIAAGIKIDKDAVAALEQILIHVADNALRHALAAQDEPLALHFTAQTDGAFVRMTFSDNGTAFDFDKLYGAVLSAGLVSQEEGAALTQEELLQYLFHPFVPLHAQTRGLLEASRILERLGGRIKASFDGGLHVTFFMPKAFLFDRLLIFGCGGGRFAVPVNMVAETVFLDKEEFKINDSGGVPFFYWKGLSLPVLDFPVSPGENAPFGLVLQAGAFTFLMPVEQLYDTEHMISFSEKPGEERSPYLVPCITLESGQEVFLADVSALLRRMSILFPRVIVPGAETEEEKPSCTSSYLIFKSEPSVFGAVCVDRVKRIDDFCFAPSELPRENPVFVSEGERYPLKDTCSRDSFPYAQAVLVLDGVALAVQEVADIIDIPAADKDGEIDFIVYRGRKVPVFS